MPIPVTTTRRIFAINLLESSANLAEAPAQAPCNVMNASALECKAAAGASEENAARRP
jgi:hypothetical protein